MFGFRLKLTLLVFCLLPALLSLGVWQLSRFQEKQVLEKMYESRRMLVPVSLSELASFSDPLYIPLELTGQFDSERYFFLDNQVWQGKAGYELFMPFMTLGGDWVLVNRGWVSMQDRNVLPDVTTEKGIHTISGLSYRSFGQAFLLSEDQWSDDWPKRIQALDIPRMAQTLKEELPAVTLVLNAGQTHAEQVRPLTLNMKASKHLGYAFQWFAMASVLLGLYFYRMRKVSNTSNSESRRA